ncbi:MAG: hypothetical protein AAGL98_00865, partial [Planctomycetota bacterium]
FGFDDLFARLRSDVHPLRAVCDVVAEQTLYKLAEQGHFPAIDVPGSISRVADDVTDTNHQAARRAVVKLIAAYRQVGDLVNIGAYAAGSNPDFDLAITCKPAIDRLLQQGRGEVQGQADFAAAASQLFALSQLLDQTRQQLLQPQNPNIRRST